MRGNLQQNNNNNNNNVEKFANGANGACNTQKIHKMAVKNQICALLERNTVLYFDSDEFILVISIKQSYTAV